MNESSQNINMEKPKCSLLAMLPKPKNIASDKSKSLLTPSALQKANISAAAKRSKPADVTSTNNNIKVAKATAVPKIFASHSLVNYGSSDSESSDVEEDRNIEKLEFLKDVEFNEPGTSNMDFFGFNSKSLPPLAVNELSSSLCEEAIDMNEPLVGPERPISLTHSYPTPFSEQATDNKPKKTISYQEATKLIYEKELAPYGGSTFVAAAAASNMIDVNVDRSLGPNVRENLLKNLNNKALAQVAVGPLPKVKKDPKDKLSKRKHQITHLAGLAVAREEMLQEQWADNKQKKKASAKKYGF